MSQPACDLCSSTSHLSEFMVAPKDTKITVCNECKAQMENPTKLNPNHWRALSESMWSENPAVQVVAWRMLNQLKKTEGWAQDLFEQMYLEDETKNWAEAMSVDEESSENNSGDMKPTKDSNGAALQDGDSVTLIKDLDVKGANFTAKRGTLVKNITLTNNPEHIEGKVNGTHIVILTIYTKKA